jgi:hypothetical protein
MHKSRYAEYQFLTFSSSTPDRQNVVRYSARRCSVCLPPSTAPYSLTTRSRSAGVSKTRRIVKRVCLPNASNVQVATKCAPGSPFLPPPWVYYDTLRFYDLPENAAVRIIGAIGTVHHLFPYAAGPYVHLLDSGCEAVRSPPMHDIVRIGHCFPDKFARRLEQSRDNDLPANGIYCVKYFAHDDYLFIQIFANQAAGGIRTRP